MGDAGFSCSWNQTSDKFAVACQDGYVCVWDVRHADKLAVLGSKQSPQIKGACRNVKFSPGGSVDLLMFSEVFDCLIMQHVSYVNIVDARTFNQKQSIRVAPANNDMHISGIAFSAEADSFYVGLENQLLEYYIDTLGRRTFPHGTII